MGSWHRSARLKKKGRLTDWVQVGGGGGLGREGSPDEGDGPGWRKGAK